MVFVMIFMPLPELNFDSYKELYYLWLFKFLIDSKFPARTR
ncbi:hypothetical protein LBBP_02760 [Leptospira borgpetersenii serovar Ballum]|uniref:Uncharacterized protein n=1 Tax=Leptospira borgpetersenii serovar Ballum TaxID=280505 RepID=A0A0S2ITI3_LEPBO|nr:hypothetical protein LBBP_02760 [Leptospira borgpetersenii serovar Ballum]